MEHGDILILGDSFCAERSLDTDWPLVVAQKLTGQKEQPRGQGFKGCSWWSVRRKFLSELEIKIPKVIIFAHTEPMRIPSDRDYSLNNVTVEDGRLHQPEGPDKQMSPALFKAGQLYYQQLISFDYHEWAITQWFKEIDEIVGSKQIEKVIHLFSFPGNYTAYTFKYGVTVDDNLFNYWQLGKGRRNHFSQDENIKIANNLYNLIVNYPGNGIRYSGAIL